MACHGLYKQDKYIIQTKVLPPHPWESLVELCQDLFEATFLPGHKRLVFCFTCADQNYKLDLSAAKSATVICAVGITFGLGGYILYKLYCKFIHPLIKKPPKKKNSGKRDETQQPKDIDGIDSEKSMGNSNSNRPETSAYFSPVSGVALHVGRKSRSRENLKTHSESSRVKLRKRTKRRKTSTDNDLTSSAPVKVPSGSNHSINQLTNSPSDLDFDGSLKANVSLHSLNDRNMRDIEFSRPRLEFLDHDDVSLVNTVSVPNMSSMNPNPSLECDRKLDNLSNKENFDNNSNRYQIELSDDLLTVSSVLLTPPSEDDIQRVDNSHCNGINSLVLHDHSNLMQNPLSSHSSGNTTDSKNTCTDNCHVSTADESCSCDEKDSISSLPKLRSPDRFFRETLMNRLHECHSFAGSSNSSSLESSPEFSPYARYRKYSIDTDNLSGLATPDSEIFNSCSEVGRSTEDQFEHLEEEVIDIEEEFASLTNKLNQLKNLAVSSDSSSVEYSPSHPLAKKAVEIVDRTRSRLSRSRSVSVSSNDSSPALSIDMPDLSWDSEGLHGDNSNKSTPSRRLGDCSSSLRNKLHAKFISKNSNGCNGVSYESPMETDVEKDGTLDNISTDDCFGNGSHSDWTHESSSDINSKSHKTSSTQDSAIAGNYSNNIPMSSEHTSSNSVYESARDSTSLSDKKEEDLKLAATNGNFSPLKSEKLSKGTTQVSQKISITEYVDKEWKGQTDKANTIRQAYKEIPKHTGCNHLCQIRGDNYCGLRGTLFQCLCCGIDLSKRWKSLNTITDKLTKRFRESHSGLKQWTFANRLPCEERQQLSLMTQCLSLLFSKFEEASLFESQSDREHWVMNLFNSDSTHDLQMMEGLKLLMFLNILDLNASRDNGEDIPIFVWLLFARDTSETPSMFVKNHLNTLGDSGGIEQIEMYLLGHTLGVRIQVLRLSHFGQEDFIAYYPDDADNNWTQVSLIAEDDRHYNVPVP